ncbi:MAG: choice-of-anchor Q domain-containing protein, partial [Phycisphaerales bacterium]|nr:choice-of-anchor Q domain-containing protein [Phycisphaerales bacterium]
MAFDDVQPRPGGAGGWGGYAQGAGLFATGTRIEAVNNSFYANAARGGKAAPGGPGGDGGVRAYGASGGNGGKGGDALGAAISIEDCTGLIQNCTFANQVAITGEGGAGGPVGFGGGGVNPPGNPGPAGINPGTALHMWQSTIEIQNSAFGHNGTNNVFGGFTDAGFNISSDDSAGFISPASRSNLDPRLAPLAENGGAIPVIGLLDDSPCIDFVTDGSYPPLDQRGRARPVGSAADCGAFEGQIQLSVTVTFTPASVPEGSISRISIRIRNPNDIPLTGISITNEFTTGTVVADDPGLAASCSGISVANAGETRIVVSGLDLAPQAECELSANVVAQMRGASPVRVVVNTDQTGTYNLRMITTLFVTGPPIAVTGMPRQISKTSAVISGVVNPEGFGTVVDFEFGLSPEFGQRSEIKAIGGGFEPVPIESTLSGLLPDKLYFYRAVARNAEGTNYGATLSLFTLGTVALPIETNLVANLASGGVVNVTCDGPVILTRPLVIERDTTLDATGQQFTLSGGATMRIFEVRPGVRLALKNLVITDGLSTNGGALYNEGFVELFQTAFIGNRSIGLAGVDGTNGTDGLPGDGMRPIGTLGTPGGDG